MRETALGKSFEEDQEEKTMRDDYLANDHALDGFAGPHVA
jgi:hypothetical protein